MSLEREYTQINLKTFKNLLTNVSFLHIIYIVEYKAFIFYKKFYRHKKINNTDFYVNTHLKHLKIHMVL